VRLIARRDSSSSWITLENGCQSDAKIFDEGHKRSPRDGVTVP